MFLKCIHCGRQSPGWVLDEQKEAARVRAERAAEADKSARRPANEHAR